MHGATPQTADQYLVTYLKVPEDETLWITDFYPDNTGKHGHHMSVEGCEWISDENFKEYDIWDVHPGYEACEGYVTLLRWAKNAPPTKMPNRVGFKVGKGSKVKYLLLTVHYKDPLKKHEADYTSGYDLVATTESQIFMAGVFELQVHGKFKIPGQTPVYPISTQCEVKTPASIIIFGTRVHSHQIGMVTSTYKRDIETDEFIEIYRGNPNWPQSFYPMDNPIVVYPNQTVVIRCVFNSLSREHDTPKGRKDSEEMCAADFMYFTDVAIGVPFISCSRISMPSLDPLFPEGVDEPLPRNEELEEVAAGKKTITTPVTYDNFI